jgi:hypothetical protein
MTRATMQSESEFSRLLGLLLVASLGESSDLGEGLREIVVLRYLTKVEKTQQVGSVYLRLGD